MVEKLESRRREKTRMVFIQAFLRLINDHSLNKITVTDIANEANYGRWAFYQYFDSKEDIAYGAFLYWMNQLDTYVIDAVQTMQSPQREYESWRIIFREFQQQKWFFVKLDDLRISIWHTYVKEFLIQQFLRHLREGRFSLMHGVRPEIAARLYVVAIMELLEYWGSNDDVGELDELVDEFFIFIFKHPPPVKL